MRPGGIFTAISTASRPKSGGELTLHFVNYNREEPAKKRSGGSGIKDEKPIAAEGVKVDLALPKGAEVKGVVAASPESPEGAAVTVRGFKDGVLVVER